MCPSQELTTLSLMEFRQTHAKNRDRFTTAVSNEKVLGDFFPPFRWVTYGLVIESVPGATSGRLHPSTKK